MVIKKKRASKQDILNNINIIDIAHEFSINVGSLSSGNFTHRCKCPSKNHKHGMERTESLYIDSVNNNFYCFGCSAASNIIDFYMLCSDTSFSEAINVLGERIDSNLIKGGKFLHRKNNFSILLDISRLIRKYLAESPNDIEWTDNLCKKIDEYCEKIGSEDMANARKLYVKVSSLIAARDNIAKEK